MLTYLRNEPARVVGLIIATIALASAFGLNVTDEQTAAIVALAGAILAIIGGESVRAQVMPMPKVRAKVARATLIGRQDAIRARETSGDYPATEVPPPGSTQLG